MAKKRPPKSEKAEHLQLADDWQGAVGKALKRKRPIGGWPEEKHKSNAKKRSKKA